MPIDLMHLHADDRLSKVCDVGNFDEFVMGSLFPDALWCKRFNMDEEPPKYLADLIGQLHYSEYIGTLRIPNCFKFAALHEKELSESSFMRGYLFHLVLDFCNNREWNSHITCDSDRFTINSNKYGKIECEDVHELVKYKYRDMYKYLEVKGFVARPINGICMEDLEGVPSFMNISLDTICDYIVDTVNSHVDEDNARTDFPEFFLWSVDYHDEIIKHAISLYMDIMGMIVVSG